MRLSPVSPTHTLPRLSANSPTGSFKVAAAAVPVSPHAGLAVGAAQAVPVPAALEITPGVNTASGPLPVPVKAKLMFPLLVTTSSGTGRLPGKAGLKVTGSEQMVPLGLLEPRVQPVTVPRVYSKLPPWEAGTVMLAIVSLAVVDRLTSSTALLAPRLVVGRDTAVLLAITFRMRLSRKSEI